MAKYSDKTLVKNERVMYRAHLSAVSYALPILMMIVGLFLLDVINIPEAPEKIKDAEIGKELEEAAGSFKVWYWEMLLKMEKNWETIKESIPPEMGQLIGSVAFFRAFYLGALLAAIAFIQFVRVYIKRNYNEYIVTNHKIMYKFGFIAVDTVEMSLDRIEGVKVAQTALDRIVNRGNLLINGVGLDQIELKGLHDPSKFRLQILEAIDRFVTRARR